MKKYTINKKILAREIIIFFSILGILIVFYVSLLIYKTINDKHRISLYKQNEDIENKIDIIQSGLDYKFSSRTKLYNVLINNVKLNTYITDLESSNSRFIDTPSFVFNSIYDLKLVDLLWNDAFYERIEYEVNYSNYVNKGYSNTFNGKQITKDEVILRRALADNKANYLQPSYKPISVRDNLISDAFDFHSSEELKNFFILNYFTDEDSMLQQKLKELNIQYEKINSQYLKVYQRRLEDYNSLGKVFGIGLLILCSISYPLRYSIYAIKWATKNI